MLTPELSDIIAKVLEVPLDHVKEELSRDNTATWDSFNHLLLISAIESEMNVKFTMAQIEQIKTVRDMAKAIGDGRS